MGAQFISGSNQIIAHDSIAPIGLPFTMACWACPIGTFGSNRAIIALANKANIQNYFYLGTTTTSKFDAHTTTGGTGVTTASNTTAVLNSWYFILARYVTTTNRWIVVYDPSTGLVDQVQTVTSNAPIVGTLAVSIGGIRGSTIFLPSWAWVGEAFYTDAELPFDPAAALPAEWVRKLALEGPFSLPLLSDDIVEYKSLLSGCATAVQTEQQSIGESYSRIGLQTWANPYTAASVPLIAPHPPISSNYVRPSQIAPILVI